MPSTIARMPISALYPYEDRESSTTRWVIIFVLLSLLAHVLIVATIFLITHFLPVPKIRPVPLKNRPLNLTFIPPPATPKKNPIFIPTTPDASAKHKIQPIESAHDTNLKSRSKTARAPDSIMPDVTGKPHRSDLKNAPDVRVPPTPQVSSSPPTPKTSKPQTPTPPQPNPQQAQTLPQPPAPNPKPHPPLPPQKPAPLAVDPVTGLPILPPLNAPTMAPRDQASPPPSPSLQQQATSMHGALGMAGDNSPAAMQTPLGKYKQYVYSVVGSYWYPDINQHFGIIPVGMVHIQFTIHADGSITDVTITEGENLDELKAISRNALIAPAPYDPFDKYPGLREDIMREQGGDGSSYTADFTFSVY